MVNYSVEAFIRTIGSTWVEYNRRLLINKALERESDEVFSIVDVGCGDGLYFSHILQHSIRCNLLVGVDTSMEAVAKARQMSKDARTECIVADAQALPFRTAIFDLAFSKDLLHHTNNPVRVLKEIKRVCYGNLIIVEANRPNFIMLLYTKFGHQHFTLDQLMSLVKKTDMKLKWFKQVYAYPITCLFLSKNPTIILWNIMILPFLFICHLVTNLSKPFLRIFSIFMKPSFNVLCIDVKDVR